MRHLSMYSTHTSVQITYLDGWVVNVISEEPRETKDIVLSSSPCHRVMQHRGRIIDIIHFVLLMLSSQESATTLPPCELFVDSLLI